MMGGSSQPWSEEGGSPTASIQPQPSSIRHHLTRIGPHGIRLAHVESGDGVPVVLVHGLGGSHRTFRCLLEEGPTRMPGYRWLAVDLPGYGDSDLLPGSPGLQDLTDAVSAWLRTQVGTAAVVAGHSMGGMVAVDLASRFPSLVKGLILVSSAGLPLGKEARIPRILRVPVLGPVALWALATRTLGQIVFRPLVADPASVAEPLVADLQWSLRRARALMHMERFYEVPTFAQAVKELPVPVGLIWGEEDRVLPPEHHLERLRSLLPRAPVVRIPRCGHVPMVEQPQAFLRAFARLLPEVARPAAGG